MKRSSASMVFRVAAVVWAACLVSGLPASALHAAGRKVGSLPVGMSPDAVEFGAGELFVLEKGTITVFSLSDLTVKRRFAGSGPGLEALSPRHTFDQAIRLAGDRLIAEDHQKILFFSRDGRLLDARLKPKNSTWFIPVRDHYAAKSMVVEGDPPQQVMRVVLYDSEFREICELYRQKWFQQQDPPKFTTELPGDLVHLAVVGDRIWVEESPQGFQLESFDADGARLQLIRRPEPQIPMTEEDCRQERIQVEKEKRVALMIQRSGSREELFKIWTITFPAFKPAIREIHAVGGYLVARTYRTRGGEARYLVLDGRGGLHRELYLPVGSDAETEARVNGTSFFKFLDGAFYYLQLDPARNGYDLYAAETHLWEKNNEPPQKSSKN